MRCAACSGTGETTDGMCSSCLGTGLVGLSRPQNAINTDIAARLAKAERALEEWEDAAKENGWPTFDRKAWAWRLTDAGRAALEVE